MVKIEMQRLVARIDRRRLGRREECASPLETDRAEDVRPELYVPASKLACFAAPVRSRGETPISVGSGSLGYSLAPSLFPNPLSYPNPLPLSLPPNRPQ